MHVVGVGGSMRPGSTTELIIRAVLDRAGQHGATTTLIGGRDLVLPPYEPGASGVARAEALLSALRRADALVIGSPGYHGSISGLVKNALDYTEELRDDPRVYLDGLPVACVATAFGWQGAVHTLGALRDIVHALRGWPTPIGIALNSAQAGVIEDGRLADDVTRNQVDIVAEHLLSFRDAHSRVA